MTIDESVRWLLRLTVEAAMTPFSTKLWDGMPLSSTNVPCAKLMNQTGWAPYILFINNEGKPCVLSRKSPLGREPINIISVEDVDTVLNESGFPTYAWRKDSWIVTAPDFRVSNWYRENGWPMEASI